MRKASGKAFRADAGGGGTCSTEVKAERSTGELEAKRRVTKLTVARPREYSAPVMLGRATTGLAASAIRASSAHCRVPDRDAATDATLRH